MLATQPKSIKKRIEGDGTLLPSGQEKIVEKLTFDQLTDIALSASKGKSDPRRELTFLGAGDVGPFVEMALRLQSWSLDLEALPALANSRIGRCLTKSAEPPSSLAVDSDSESFLGILRLDAQSGNPPDTAFTQLGIRAKRAAVAAGFPDLAAASLVGAVMELRDNVIEHSHRPESGIVAFAARKDRFEFCVADGGKGVLESLRENSRYANLSNSGQALLTALTDGESRHGPGVDRGYGFHDLFVALQKVCGTVHFKSGDHRLEHNGLSPTVRELDLAQCADLRGFLVSAVCLAAPVL